MTREEALETLIDNAENGYVDIEEVKLVFSELEQEPCEDTISRQAAIDAIKKIHPVDTEYDCTLYDKIDVMYVLKDLPSIKALEQEPCEDAISRQAVIEITAETGALETQIRVKALPPVTPQPKPGTWKKDIDNSRTWDRIRFYCSECGDWQTYGETDFCPNCGVKMEKSEGKECR